MRQRILTALLAVTLSASLSAQVVGPLRVTAVSTGSDCSVAAACASFTVGSVPSLTLQITGTFVGTLTFEATADGNTWRAVALADMGLTTGAVATTATAPGQFAFVNLGSLQIRVRATAFTSGSAAVTMTRGVGNRPLASGGGGGGATLPTAALGQALMSQGVGTAPIFSNKVTLSTGGEFRIGDLVIGQFQMALPQAGVHAAALKPIPRTYGGPDDQPGELWNFTDSPVSTPGAVITGGGGTNSVLARWSGTNYVVIGGVAGAGGLPTAPLQQVLISQGAGVPPIFSNDLTILGTLTSSHLIVSNFNVVGGSIRLAEHALSALPTGTSLGDLANFSDSTTAARGAIVAGGGTNHILARWNGTNWIVIGGAVGVSTTELAADIVTSTTSAATLTPAGGNIRNLYVVTAQAVPATVAAPSGTPVDGSYLTIRVKGTAGHPVTWNPIYRGGSVPLPTATTVRTSYISFRYNSAEAKWDLVSLTSNF